VPPGHIIGAKLAPRVQYYPLVLPVWYVSGRWAGVLAFGRPHSLILFFSGEFRRFLNRSLSAVHINSHEAITEPTSKTIASTLCMYVERDYPATILHPRGAT